MLTDLKKIWIFFWASPDSHKQHLQGISQGKGRSLAPDTLLTHLKRGQRVSALFCKVSPEPASEVLGQLGLRMNPKRPSSRSKRRGCICSVYVPVCYFPQGNAAGFSAMTRVCCLWSYFCFFSGTRYRFDFTPRHWGWLHNHGQHRCTKEHRPGFKFWLYHPPVLWPGTNYLTFQSPSLCL